MMRFTQTYYVLGLCAALWPDILGIHTLSPRCRIELPPTQAHSPGAWQRFQAALEHDLASICAISSEW